jgi:hypothetical protein
MRRKIGFWEAYSIGVGGMIGGGIFAVLGLTILLSKGAAPVAFILGFILCLISGAVLVKYNIKTSPSSLESLTLVLLRAFIFELFYRTFTTVRLKPYIDWRLEEGERFIKNFEYFLTLIEKNLKHELEDTGVKVDDPAP